MALYLKQDFNPRILSKKWMAIKFRPNMLLYSHYHTISILESGLLFREDSIEVEQEANAGALVDTKPWLTLGEQITSTVAVGVAIVTFPPTSFRSPLFHLAAYVSLPVAVRLLHRHACKGTLQDLLEVMRDYLTLARRAMACLRECAAMRAELGSVASAIESAHAMLSRQQSELAVTMSRTSSALLGNVPWLRSDVAWDVLPKEESENLLKVHHAFLVVQSTLLKHIALAHIPPSPQTQRLYKNHNERIYWIHTVLIQNLTEEFSQNFEALDRMYRLLKNYVNADQNVTKKPGAAIFRNWLYSDVHSDIARANLELKLALNKCNNLDTFLDSCAMQRQELDLEVLNKDIDSLIGGITKCLATAQSSQIRLRKLMGKFKKHDLEPESKDEVIENDRVIMKIEDREPEVRDEVFYCVKTDDDDTPTHASGDVCTGPGRKEKETTKVVLNELRRKLVNREDAMRERERQALAKAMPELKGKVPEFPRQINLEEVLDRKGYISKLKRDKPKKRLFRAYKIQRRRCAYSLLKTRFKFCIKYYNVEEDIKSTLYEANAKFVVKSKLLTFAKTKLHQFVITVWHKVPRNNNDSFDISDYSEGLSDVEGGAVNKSVHETVNVNNTFEENREKGDARNYRFSKKDLELSPSSSDDESGVDNFALLNDIRRYRVARKKNYPNKKVSHTAPRPEQEESLRPTEYSLGAGLAMASVLQARSAGAPPFVQEEVFIGDGEVSGDSGNDDN